MNYASPSLACASPLGASPAVPDASQIDAKLNELEHELRMLQALCSSIHERCQSVMNPSTPAKDTNANQALAILSPLGNRIYTLSAIAFDVNRGLTDFLSRLAL